MRWTALVAVLVATGCLRGIRPEVSGVVDVAPEGGDMVRLTYLGVGGWIIERGDVQLLAAPLFTNPSLLRLVGHAHYDHLMDVPQVARRHAPQARILGSRTVLNTLGTWSGVAGRVDVVEDHAGGQFDLGRWMPLGQGLRVLPLRSLHARRSPGGRRNGLTDRPTRS
jgi:hypothetical protein